ncbi:MAG: hypothetical protein AABP62_06730 [Planctomycetota bacterium]
MSITMAILAIGCGETDRKYIPSESTARGALEAALNAWKSGAAHGTVKGFQVPIDTFDARWQAGKKLDEFEVLREEPSDGPKTFVVKMKLADEPNHSEITYLVVGKDPLLVFRREDYNKASGMGDG